MDNIAQRDCKQGVTPPSGVSSTKKYL